MNKQQYIQLRLNNNHIHIIYELHKEKSSNPVSFNKFTWLLDISSKIGILDNKVFSNMINNSYQYYNEKFKLTEILINNEKLIFV